MTRKRSKSKGTAFDYLPGHHGNNNGNSASSPRLSSFDSLPNETLLLIFANLQFPSRQYACLVCRRWRDLLLEPPFCRYVASGQSLSEALQASSPGDTLICLPGMYQETLLVDKPVRVVAEDYWRAERRLRHRRRGRDASEGVACGTQPAAVLIEQVSGPGFDGPCSALAAPGQQPQQQYPQPLQHEWVLLQEQMRQRSGGSAVKHRGAPSSGGSGCVGIRARPSVPSVAVLSLRPPVVVMDSRCCFVGFEFHTTVVHNEVSICCFGPNSPLARFEHCTFSGLTGLRVPYSKGSQTRLELYDCTLLGTTQSLAAVQMDAGKLLMNRCGIQNNSVGVEVGPEALARLADCELRWCGTALVVDGCLAMANCRLWGNGKLGNLNTDARLRAAQSYSEACLAAGGPPPLPPWANKQQEEQLPEQAQEGLQPPSALPSCNRSRRRGPRGGGGPLGDAGAGTSTAAAVASTSDGALTSLAPAIVQSIHQQIQDGNAGGSGSGGGASSISPNRVATLAAAQWAEVSAAFASRQQLVRVVGCEVTAPQLIMRTGLHKEVRKKARELVRQVYGAPDDDLFPEWEVLVHSDLDSDMDEEDSSVTSGSVMADDEDLEDEDEDPLDLADDPDLDESGESQSGSDSDSSSGSGSGDAADEMDRGAAVADGEAGEAEGEDEEWGAGESLSSGRGSSDSSSDSDSRESDSDTSDSSGSGDSDTSDSSGSGDSDSGNGNEHDSSSGNTDDAGGSSVRPH